MVGDLDEAETTSNYRHLAQKEAGPPSSAMSAFRLIGEKRRYTTPSRSLVHLQSEHIQSARSRQSSLLSRWNTSNAYNDAHLACELAV